MKAFLFDFGGTIDTNGIHWSEKYWDAYVLEQVNVEKPHYEKAYVAADANCPPGYIQRTDTMHTMLSKQVPLQFAWLRERFPNKRDAFSDDVALRIADHCYTEVQKTVRRAIPVLEILSKKAPLALVSNFGGNLRAVCRDLNIERYFSCFVDSTLVGVRKPNPEIFAIALRELGVEARDAVVIGDSYERDIEPAKILGCTTVWLRGRSWCPQPGGPAADYIVNSLQDYISHIIQEHL